MDYRLDCSDEIKLYGILSNRHPRLALSQSVQLKHIYNFYILPNTCINVMYEVAPVNCFGLNSR